MPTLTPEMDNVQVALDREWVIDRTDYICGLYRTWADDLLRAQRLERKFYESLAPYHAYFGDIGGEFLYMYIRENLPGVVVDVGVGCGYSTSWLLQALIDNEVGHLTSCDIKDDGLKWLIPHFGADLAGRWEFLHGDALEQTFPDKIDVLLSDSNHDMPYAKTFVEVMFPKVVPGGLITVHDVFQLKTPAHGEAEQVFRYLDSIDTLCYTVSNCFEEQHAKLLAVRREIGMGPTIHVNDLNGLLIFDVPGRDE